MTKSLVRALPRYLFFIGALSALLAVIAVSWVVFSAYRADHTSATPPPTMNFQGRLLSSSGSLMPDGLYNMRFAIYDTPTAGTALWSEAREATSRVEVTNGLFTTQLGQVTPLSPSIFAATNLYFEITMATPATATCTTAACASWESPMTPRNKLATSAYAFNAASLNGRAASDFAAASGSANYIQNTATPQSASFNISGTGAVGGRMSIGAAANLGQLTVSNTSVSQVGLVIQGAVSQTADLMQIANAAGTNLFQVGSTGTMTVRGSCAGCTTMTFSNSGGGPSTISSDRNIILTSSWTASAPSIEVGFVEAKISAGGAGHSTVVLNTSGGNAATVFGSNNNRRVSFSSNNPQDLGGRINLTTDGATTLGMVVRGHASQTADLLQAQNSTGAVLASISANGSLTIAGDATFNGRYVTFSSNVRGYNVNVTAASTTLSVTFTTAHPDANYAVTCTPSWSTTCFVTNKTANGFTLNFGTAAPAGARADWMVVR